MKGIWAMATKTRTRSKAATVKSAVARGSGGVMVENRGGGEMLGCPLCKAPLVERAFTERYAENASGIGLRCEMCGTCYTLDSVIDSVTRYARVCPLCDGLGVIDAQIIGDPPARPFDPNAGGLLDMAGSEAS